MEEFINKRKSELEDQLRSNIVNRALMQEQIENLDDQIMNIRTVLIEFNALEQSVVDKSGHT